MYVPELGRWVIGCRQRHVAVAEKHVTRHLSRFSQEMSGPYQAAKVGFLVLAFTRFSKTSKIEITHGTIAIAGFGHETE